MIAQTDSSTPYIIPPLTAYEFPAKLFKMLADAETEGNADIFSWLPDGLSFRIHKRSEFITHILPKHYSRVNIRSFLRQLNLYGFKREKDKKSNAYGAYHHEHFIRSDELGILRRRMVSRQGNKQKEGRAKISKNSTELNKRKIAAYDEDSCGDSHSSGSIGLERVVAIGPEENVDSVTQLSEVIPTMPNALSNFATENRASISAATASRMVKMHRDMAYCDAYGINHEGSGVSSITHESEGHEYKLKEGARGPFLAPMSLSDGLDFLEPYYKKKQVFAMFLCEQDATELLNQGVREFVRDKEWNMVKIKAILEELEPFAIAPSR